MFEPLSIISQEGIRPRGWWGGRAQEKTHTGERPPSDWSKVSLAGASYLDMRLGSHSDRIGKAHSSTRRTTSMAMNGIVPA